MNKPKRPSISSEDIELFRKSCGPTQPIKNDKLHLMQARRLPQIMSKPPRIPNFSYEFEGCCSPDEKLYFARSGLQNKILNQLRRGQIKIEARTDLHRLTSNEAIEHLEKFLANAQAHRFKWVLIIHGKGQYAKEGKSILKSLVNDWLPKQNAVLAFASSRPKDGGTGAVYVLLKRNSASGSLDSF